MIKEVNLDIHPIAMVKLISKTGKFTVPQTNINGKWISGFDQWDYEKRYRCEITLLIILLSRFYNSIYPIGYKGIIK